MKMMKHESTTIVFTGKEGEWKVVYSPSDYGRPKAIVYLNDAVVHDFGDHYPTKMAQNPTKTQALGIVKEARKILTDNK